MAEKETSETEAEATSGAEAEAPAETQSTRLHSVALNIGRAARWTTNGANQLVVKAGGLADKIIPMAAGLRARHSPAEVIAELRAFLAGKKDESDDALAEDDEFWRLIRQLRRSRFQLKRAEANAESDESTEEKEPAVSKPKKSKTKAKAQEESEEAQEGGSE